MFKAKQPNNEGTTSSQLNNIFLIPTLNSYYLSLAQFYISKMIPVCGERLETFLF